VNIEEQVELLMQGTEYGDEELKKAMANELRQRLLDRREMDVLYESTVVSIRRRPICISGIRSPCASCASSRIWDMM
jgi:hypothetical protein